MNHVMCAVLVIVTMLSPTSAFGQAASAGHVVVPPRVTKLILPILDAMQQAFDGPHPLNEQEGSPLWNAGVMMGKLFDNKSPASDEALVVLLYYYLGESNGEDQFQEIICRGNRMLPYLRKYQLLSPEILQRHYSKEVLLERKTVSEKFKDIADEINKGHSAIACQSQP